MTVSLTPPALLESVNPATLEPLGSVTRTPPDAVVAVVDEARRAQAAWSAVPLRERGRLLQRVRRVLIDEMDELAAVIAAETGKPLAEAYATELVVAADTAAWLARCAERVLRPERSRLRQLHLRQKRARVVYEPYGVIAVISPWNFPFSIPFTGVAHVVAAGNAAVLKPSELTPLCGEWVARVFELAEAPPGLVQVVQGEREVGEALVAARGVDKIVFTGSTEVGRSVAAAAAERLCPVTLELGGKDAMLVFADADLERAADGALWGAFANCGQICTSVERIYVERPLHAEFVERLAARARGLRVGEELGPLVSEAQRARVEELVESARDRIVTGGARPQLDLPGWFYEPTVIDGTSERLEREEIFGPVVTVEPFDGEDGAVARANASRFGLGASVWTRDAARARRVAARLEAGMVWVNDVSYSYAAGQTPWGGVKESGFGRTHSKHGLYECVRVKYADADSGRLRVPWWFPYGDGAVEGFRTMLDVFHGDGIRSLRRHGAGVRWLAKRYLGR